MSEYYDTLETRDPEDRERDLFTALARQLANARENSTYYAQSLADVDVAAVEDRAALAALPVTRKSDLPAIQCHLNLFLQYDGIIKIVLFF